MKDPQSPGDTPREEFRKQLHELADWVADFRENIESLRVAPGEKPGAIRAQLPAQGPEEGQSFEKILADVDRLIVPGMVSGWIQSKIGYERFFLWVLVSSVPAMIMGRFVPIHGPRPALGDQALVEAD